MPDTPIQPRFRAHAADVDRCRDHAIPDATSCVEAAVLFAEQWAADEGQLSIHVIDNITGEKQCFHIDLDTNEAEPC